MRNGFRVTDAHCHVYPDAIAEKAAENTGRFYAVGHELDGKVGTLVEASLKAGVDHCVIQSVATTPRQVESINRFISATVAEGEGFFTGLGALHPDSDDQRRDVETLISLGLHGVKLHPEIQRFALDEPRALAIFALCEEYGLPVLLHTGDRRYDCSNPNRLIPVLKRFPDLTVVGAHLGGWSIWDEAVDALCGVKNLWFDCSSTFAWVDPLHAKDLILRLGVDRVMFGTDYPMWTPKTELDTFLSLGFSEHDSRLILWENAARVFSVNKTE
jgi:predicted TIM-barrel fold metal-dependent hydrolase